MTLSPVPVESFGGLNLNDDAGTVGWNGCVDCLNTEVIGGRVRSRRGYRASVGTSAAQIDSAHWVRTTGTDYIIVGTTGSALQVFDAAFSGAAATVTRVDTTTGTSQSASAAAHNFVSFGDTTNEYVYIANGSNQIRRFKPSTLTFTEPGGLSAYTTRCLAITPWDNRLVTEGVTQKSRVWFSDAGTPETIGANNYIDLEPGDGERIMAIKAWRDLLFVFKQTKFYVFYGTSTDSTGNPIFNYRAVRAGVGVDSTTPTFGQRAVAVGPDALYFVSAQGIYRTTGGPPECVSKDLDPLFRGGVSVVAPFFTGASDFSFDPEVATALSLTWAEGRLYFCSQSALFVWDPGIGWMEWSVPGNSCEITTLSPYSGVLLGGNSTTAYFYERDSTATTDNGTSITSRYRSGFSDIGSPDEKAVREWVLEGSGTPTLKTSFDFGSLETGASVTLGTSPAVAEARRRYAIRGRYLSWQTGATSPWSLNSLVANVREKRSPGRHAAE